MLRISQYRKLYNGRTILTIDDFVINPGVHWIQGSNGSGKSTLLKTIAGIISFEGTIVLAESLNSKKQSAAYRSKVNFAEAEPIFPDFLTGYELIQLFKAAKKGARNQEDFYVESMGMTSYLSDPVGTYSSGMLKKLSLVLAFMGQPSCILLDEPLTTLDAGSLPILYSWIMAHYQQHGTLFLLSSHQVFEEEIGLPVQEIVVANTTIQYHA